MGGFSQAAMFAIGSDRSRDVAFVLVGSAPGELRTIQNDLAWKTILTMRDQLVPSTADIVDR